MTLYRAAAKVKRRAARAVAVLLAHPQLAQVRYWYKSFQPRKLVRVAGGANDPFANLRAFPQFDALRLLVQNNPQMLQPGARCVCARW
jgi:hypothetical protein